MRGTPGTIGHYSDDPEAAPAKILKGVGSSSGHLKIRRGDDNGQVRLSVIEKRGITVTVDIADLIHVLKGLVE